ncbi:CUE domain-containing protein 1-like isoform X2 [Glandiceps talaboti]
MAMAPESQPASSGKSKKSRFRRSSSGQPGNTTANNMVSVPSRQLEFTQAMSDFKTMFPKMDNDVIEAVLRANNGAVDATIDQLLVMNVDMSQEENRRGLPDDALPPEVFEPTSDDDEPPPAYTPHVDQSTVNMPGMSPPYTPHPEMTVPPSPVAVQGTPPTRPYRNWNPPLLGSLPDDFLRVGSSSTPPPATSQPTSMVTAQLQKQLEINRQQCSEIDQDDLELKQQLADEKLAIMLQNEEFMRELQANPEFLSSLERDQSSGGGVSMSSNTQLGMPSYHGGAVGAGAAHSSSSHGTQADDADFKDKLSHMGKSTKKKFSQLAKKFQRRKKKSSKHNLQESAAAPSTANLLDNFEDDDEDDSDDDDVLQRRERNSQADDRQLPSYQISQQSPYRGETVLTLSNDTSRNEAIV